MSYRHPELIPPLKFWPHPQSCAVSTHRPMKARELASSAERLSSRATPTNTTCHAAELHVRPRSCRAFARRGRESSPPIDASFEGRTSCTGISVDFSVLLSSRHTLFPLLASLIVVHISSLLHCFVFYAEEKNRPADNIEEDTETSRS